MARLKEWLRSWFPPNRDNEYDIGSPGEERPLTGLFHTLSDEQKKGVLSYRGPECLGTPPPEEEEPRRIAR
jgi:hypothetical protein